MTVASIDVVTNRDLVRICPQSKNWPVLESRRQGSPSRLPFPFVFSLILNQNLSLSQSRVSISMLQRGFEGPCVRNSALQVRSRHPLAFLDLGLRLACSHVARAF